MTDQVHMRPMTEVESNLMTQVLALRRQVGAVRRLHQQYRPAFDHPTDVCSHCTRGMDLVTWPCATVQALDGTLPTTVQPRLIVFTTEDELHDHAERLNQIGVNPDVPIMDSRGHAVLASRTAPGGDGWGFEYYAPGEDGFMHCCNCSECGLTCAYRTPGWKPFFPVTGLIGYDLSGTEGLT